MRRRAFLVAAASLVAWPAPAAVAPRRLQLANAHTGERFDGPYRSDDGPDREAMKDLAAFLRDHHSGKAAPIDVAVLDFLAEVMAAVGATRATVLSAYRTPETNRRLAATRFGVADLSQHIFGRAIDITLDRRLAEAADAARAMRRGGVGWYPRSGFIHLDSGPVRTWTFGEANLRSLLWQGLVVPGGRRPPTVRQRLAIHRDLARRQFLARTGRS